MCALHKFGAVAVTALLVAAMFTAASASSTAAAVADRSAASDRQGLVDLDPPTKSIADTRVPALEIEAACAKNASHKECQLDESELRKSVENAGKVIEQVLATKEFVDEIKNRPKGPVLKSVAQKIISKEFDKGLTTPQFKKYAKALKPTKGGMVLWGANVAMTLTDKNATTVDKIESVASIIPIAGQVISFGNAITKGDVEGVITATIALGGVAAMLACPPLGTAVQVGLAAYAIGKALWDLFASKESGRDWAKQPPGTVEELFERGAHMEWETSVSEEGVHKLLLDSKKSIDSGEPGVTYTFSTLGWFPGPAHINLKTVNVVSGKKTAKMDCYAFYAQGVVQQPCKFKDPKDRRSIIVSPGHPAVLQFDISHGFGQKWCKDRNQPDHCELPPARGLVGVTPQNGNRIAMSLNLRFFA